MIAKAPLRISLFGGGSDLPMFRDLTGSGGCVLSCTIDKYTYLQNGVAWNDIPPGSGLGGSGAACVARAKLGASLYSYGAYISDRELFNRAWFYETEQNPHAGWQDVAASFFGGLNLFTFEEELQVEPIPIPPGLDERLLLFSTGVTRKASEPLAMQAEQMPTDPFILNNLTIAAEMASTASAYLEAERLHWIGPMLHEAWQDKRRLPGVTTPAIDHAYDAARNAGAAGGKLCGAGGGGYMLFYVEPDAQGSVRAAMAGLGMDELVFHLTAQGASLI